MYSRAARRGRRVGSRLIAGVGSRGAGLRVRWPGRAGNGVGVGKVRVWGSDCWILLEVVMKARRSKVMEGVVRAWRRCGRRGRGRRGRR